MDNISKKIASRLGFPKAILMIREKTFVSRKARSCLVMMVSIVLDMSEVIAM